MGKSLLVQLAAFAVAAWALCSTGPQALSRAQAAKVQGGACHCGCVRVYSWNNATSFWHTPVETAEYLYANPIDGGPTARVYPDTELRKATSGVSECPWPDWPISKATTQNSDFYAYPYARHTCPCANWP
jgi:hypothetical protein